MGVVVKGKSVVFVRSGSTFISCASINADSVMDVGRGSSELPKGAKLNKSSYLNLKKS